MTGIYRDLQRGLGLFLRLVFIICDNYLILFSFKNDATLVACGVNSWTGQYYAKYRQMFLVDVALIGELTLIQDGPMKYITY